MSGAPRVVTRDEIAKWFALYYEPLHQFLMKRMASSQAASDLRQETFLRLLRAQRGELIQTPRTYVFHIAGKLAYERHLRERRNVVTFNSAVADRAARTVGAAAADPSEHIDNERLIEAVLRRLPSRYATMLVMRGRDGMSMKEIAAVMDLSENTVKKYLERAVSMIRVQRGFSA